MNVIEDVIRENFNLLLDLNKYGLIRKSILVEKYGTSDKYQNNWILKKLYLLEEYKIIKSFGRSFGLGVKGKKILQKENIELNYMTLPVKEKALALYKDNDILLNLNFKNIQSRIEYIKERQKLQKEVNNVRTFAGVVYNDLKRKYLVYRIKGKLTNAKISLINSDLQKGFINRVIIFFDFIDYQKERFNKQYFELIKVLNKFNCSELIALPNSKDGYDIINFRNEGIFSNKNIKNYIEKKEPNSIEIINENNVYFKDEIAVNLLNLDFKKMANQIELSILNKDKKIFFIVPSFATGIFRNFDSEHNEDIFCYRNIKNNIELSNKAIGISVGNLTNE